MMGGGHGNTIRGAIGGVHIGGSVNLDTGMMISGIGDNAGRVAQRRSDRYTAVDMNLDIAALRIEDRPASVWPLTPTSPSTVRVLTPPLAAWV